MKKKLLLFMFFAGFFLNLNANVVTHTFCFKESDFVISADDKDSLSIISIKETAIYPESTEPWIPIIGKNLVLSEDETISNVTYTFNKRLIRSGVKLKNAPLSVSTIGTKIEIPICSNGYEAKEYPKSNCTLSRCHKMGCANVASFLVTPFVYDAVNYNLYFVDSLQVSLAVKPSLARGVSRGVSPVEMAVLQSIVENTDDLIKIPIDIGNIDEDEYVEYVIITSENLKESFEPLADWKRKKGVPSRIITTEEIEQQYLGQNKKIKIKSCIKDLHENNGTQFVLLGGDVEIIPVQYSYVKNKNTNDTANIPTDVYYASLTDLDWDSNVDSITKELYQIVDVVPNIFVARVPARNEMDVSNFVNRIIEYEKTPNFTHAFFQTGSRLDYIKKGEAFADSIFNEVINGKVRIETYKLFDTYSYTGQNLSYATLISELQKGFQFVEIISHGKETLLVDDNGRPFCNLNVFSDINNVGHTLVTTTACLTNAFDRPEQSSLNPCLSEALLRNPNSNVIGYLGSTREGWIPGGIIPRLELSFSYEKDFYERLFDAELMPKVKHFGALVNFIKHTHLCYLNERDAYRWLHFSLNALGDPETPIYTDIPLINTAATISTNNDILVVDAGVVDAKVCISSADSGTFYEVTDEKLSIHQPGYGLYDVWITKQNYIPKHFQVQVGFDVPLNPVETTILSISPNPADNIINVQYQCMLVNADLKLVLTRTSGVGLYQFDLNATQNEVSVDISSVPSGVYVVNLVENGTTLPSFSSRLVVE